MFNSARAYPSRWLISKSSRPREFCSIVEHLDPSRAELAGDLGSQVFRRHSQPLCAVRAIAVHAEFFDSRIPEIKLKYLSTKVALNLGPSIFRTDSQLLIAVRAGDKITPRRYVQNALELLDGNKRWNGNAVRMQIGI